jgi:LEA14-like dessication related protein
MRFFNKILILCCALSLCSCIGELKEISINQITNFKINKIDLKSIDAEISVSITNPNSKSFKIYRSRAEVFVVGSNLGTAKIVKKVKIPANSVIDNIFVLHGDFKDLNLGTLANITMGKPAVEIKGYLKAGKWFYKKKFPINEKQKISSQGFKGILPGF